MIFGEEYPILHLPAQARFEMIQYGYIIYDSRILSKQLFTDKSPFT